VTALAALAPIGVVSADSRQLYRGLDIGTAKPTAAERAAAPYYGFDLVEPTERYAAGRFAREAAVWIADVADAGRLPVVVGGTGLYLRALFEGLFAEPTLDAARRGALRAVLGRRSTESLLAWARRLDTGFAGRDRQRALRALEIGLLTGTPLSRLQRRAAPGPAAPPPVYVRLALPRTVLAERIAVRTRAMLAAGLVDEVRGLLAAGVPADAPGLNGVGYREVIAHLGGRLAADALEGAITAATRQYAKRQETWFRHQLPPGTIVLDAARTPDALAREVLAGYRAALGGAGERESGRSGG
jgi:tRNA dimethylallyltransferase